MYEVPVNTVSTPAAHQDRLPAVLLSQYDKAASVTPTLREMACSQTCGYDVLMEAKKEVTLSMSTP